MLTIYILEESNIFIWGDIYYIKSFIFWVAGHRDVTH